MDALLLYADCGAPSAPLRLLEVGVYHTVLADAGLSVSSRRLAAQFTPEQLNTAFQMAAPRVVALYADEFNGHSIVQLAEWIGARFPDTPLTVIGPLTILDPDSLIGHPSIRYLLAGEAEIALYELITALGRGAELSQIRNLWHRDGKQVARNALRPLQENLDLIPFADRDLVNEFIANDEDAPLYLQAARGCPFDCAFCYSPVLKKAYTGKGAYFRFRSPSNLAAEARACLKQRSFSRVVFADEIFPTDRRWLKELAQAWQGLPPFEAAIATERVDGETLSLLRAANCETITLGIETASDAIRRRVASRNLDRAALLFLIEAWRVLGGQTAVSFLAGLPGETRESAAESLAFARDLGAGDIRVRGLVPIVSTPVAAAAKIAAPIPSPDFQSTVIQSESFTQADGAAHIQRMRMLRMALQLREIPAITTGLDLLRLLPKARFQLPKGESASLRVGQQTTGEKFGILRVHAGTTIRYPLEKSDGGALLFQVRGAALSGDLRIEILSSAGGEDEPIYHRVFRAGSQTSAWHNATASVPAAGGPTELLIRVPQLASAPATGHVEIARPVLQTWAEYAAQHQVTADPSAASRDAETIAQLRREVESLREQMKKLTAERDDKARRAAVLAEQVIALEKAQSPPPSADQTFDSSRMRNPFKKG